MDLLVVPRLSFRLLYGFLVLRHRRRRIMWPGVTTSPTAEWIAQQVRRLRAGRLRRILSCAIAIALMARYSSAGFARWAFVTNQRHRDCHGRMPTLNG
jgi:hypothetical protein